MEKAFNGYSLAIVKDMIEELKELVQKKEIHTKAEKLRFLQPQPRALFLYRHLSRCVNPLNMGIPDFKERSIEILIQEVEKNILCFQNKPAT